METLEAIYNRQSIREYTDQEITKEEVEAILKAGMSGPSCVNAKDWAFIVVQNPETLEKMADANGRPAKPLRGAKLGILVCGDLNKAFERAKDYWIEDASIAAQNMLIAAYSLNIGSVWLGSYPQMDRVERLKELFGLPEEIVPLGILSFGHYDSSKVKEKPEIFIEEDVHYEKW